MGGVLGSALGTGLGFKTATDAWRRQKRVLQKGIQWKVADLRKAGLNPILAAGGGLGGGSAPGVQAAKIPAIGQDINTGRKVSSENRLRTQQGNLLTSQIRETDSRTRVNSGQELKLSAETESIRKNTKRWSPFSDIGGAASRDITGPLSDWGVDTIDDFITSAPGRGLRSMTDRMKKGGFINKRWDNPSNARDIKRIMRALTYGSPAWGDRWKDTK